MKSALRVEIARLHFPVILRAWLGVCEQMTLLESVAGGVKKEERGRCWLEHGKED